ncbi:excisionase family DNA-binding protein [Bacteroidia bacterium]|nr:excisionase family DNA-binding protein [Bacteroidia bacterium]
MRKELNFDLRDFISRREAAQLIGISIPTLDRKIKDGSIKAYTIPGGRRVFIRKDDLFNSLICFNDAA